MTLEIKQPDVERRVRQLAENRGISPEQLLLDLIQSHLPPEHTERRPFYETATPEEWNAALDRIAARFPQDAPLLPDEALRRENLYDDRGV